MSDLTNYHERRVDDPDQSRPWNVRDAPDEFITKQLTAIVGIEVAISRVELKRKMSQNKPDADRLGAANGLRRSTDQTDHAVAVTAQRAQERSNAPSLPGTCITVDRGDRSGRPLRRQPRWVRRLAQVHSAPVGRLP